MQKKEGARRHLHVCQVHAPCKRVAAHQHGHSSLPHAVDDASALLLAQSAAVLRHGKCAVSAFIVTNDSLLSLPQPPHTQVSHNVKINTGILQLQEARHPVSPVNGGGEHDSNSPLHLQQRVNEDNQLVVRGAHGHVSAGQGGVT